MAFAQLYIGKEVDSAKLNSSKIEEEILDVLPRDASGRMMIARKSCVVRPPCLSVMHHLDVLISCTRVSCSEPSGNLLAQGSVLLSQLGLPAA